MEKYILVSGVFLFIISLSNAASVLRTNSLQSEIKNGQCGGTIELDSGSLIYPGEGTIIPGELCIWTIHLRTMDGFRMNFTSLDVPGNNPECVNAAVSIYGLSNLIPSNDPEMYRFCNENENGGYHYLTGNIATIVFYTSVDFSEEISATGFSLHWEGSRFQDIPIMHSSTYTSTPTGLIWYPVEGEYAPNSALTWLVNAAGPNNASSLILDVLSVDFESCSLPNKCHCEALIIYDISQAGQLQEVDRFCGERESAVLPSVSTHFIVAFYSDNANIEGEGFGFQVDWKQESEVITTTTMEPNPTTSETPEDTTTTNNPITTESPPETTTEDSGPILRSCGGIIEADSGTIEYAMDEAVGVYAACIWTIRPSNPTTHIELIKEVDQFSVFDTLRAVSLVAQQGAGDSVGFRSTHGEEVAVLTGSVVLLRYANSGLIINRGFRLNFRAVGDPQPLIQHSYDFNTGSLSGSIDYPPGNVNYQNYELSTFVLTHNYTENISIRITINSLSMEISSGCFHDTLLVYHFNSNGLEQLARLCGNSNEPLVLTPKTSYVVVLLSDGSRVGGGFQALWHTI